MNQKSVAMMALARLQAPAVNYMELTVLAGAFSCGNCRFASASPDGGGFCLNQTVRAPVSASHGCCNLFVPAHSADQLEPFQWEAFR